ncbi:response regulator transcription factor [Noviherbaspirillum suwonense]|jgi:DNA-binding response OmpR family regulator|uniref:Two component transcriptional regulator, winged helix family n=1 Tax=Noviherbaspirillum suwonense TaxID=1224511 RepID=A0ABY1QBE9_9BURK|nr:response regulator transcription factor [Noviherbaspirillum suwonense]RYE40602.1 MAG: response regulator transcription factor [Hyphomicrobiales bacterium]SMP66059.1 two component transcriptional regulator, winged helix family [Noviherbaspirillum suwonense]
MRIAVLDNDRHQSELVCQVLSTAGHGCQTFGSSRELMTQARRDSFDMLIIHWHLPEGGASEAVHWVRDRFSATFPIMFITGRSNEDDIVAGLAAGADDYMIKPIRRGELVARVQALLRRAYPTQNAVEQIQFGGYVFQSRTGRVTMQGKPIDVTQKEFDLALLFFRNLGRPLSRAYILEAVWSRDVQIPSRTMDTHVSRVRSKLQLRPEHGFRLAPVYSYGYRLEQMSSGGVNNAAHNGSKHSPVNDSDAAD